MALAIAVLALASTAVEGRRLLRARQADGVCGKGFGKLVAGSQKYFKTAEEELQCWFAYMAAAKCGDLPSQYGARNKELTATCLDYNKGWLEVWKMFSKAEFKWFKKSYPANEITPEDEAVLPLGPTSPDAEDVADEETAEPAAAIAAETVVHDREALATAKEMVKKELLCLTLFTT